MLELFAQGTRAKIRFATHKGLIAIEDLWDLPLESKSPTVSTLDTLSREVNKELRETEETSFVRTSTKSVAASELRLKLDILLYIIQVKLQEQESRVKAAETRAKKAKLLDLIEQKENEQMSQKTLDELRKELDSL